MFPLRHLVIVALLTIPCKSIDKPTVTIVNFIVGNSAYSFSAEKVSASYDLGVEKLRSLLGDRVNIKYIRSVYEPPCNANHVGALAAKFYYTENVTLFMGPACSPEVDVVGRMASSWNIPIMSPVGTNSILGNKNDFKTLTRLAYNFNKWANIYFALFDLYHWTDIAIIQDKAHHFFGLIGDSFDGIFTLEGLKVYRQIYNSLEPHNMETILTKARSHSRVFMMAMYGDDLRINMLIAQRLGMTSGEYVFIYSRSSKGDSLGDISWRRGDDLDADVKRAYQSVLFTQPRRPETQEFITFEEEVKSKSLTDYGYSYGEVEVNLFISAAYDAFQIYAHVLNETLTLGEDYSNGTLLKSKIWGETFRGVTGDIVIDANGDRDTQFSLIDVEPVSGEYKIVADYWGLQRGLEFTNRSRIHWPNNAGPPLNTPRCGYLGDSILCKEDTGMGNEALIAITFSVTMLAFAGATFAIYRKFKLESELHDQWWKVRWKDVVRLEARSRIGSCLSFQSASHFGSVTDAHNHFVVATYKSNTVVIQYLHTKCVKVDRQILLELKQMRDMQCINLTRLHGLCLEEPTICLLTEHCGRGSLQDMLHNGSIKLDKDFKLSLLNDITTGMGYIHGSPFEYHGRLNSGNCVIDSRFVLKIADFGLPSIRAQEQTDNNANNHVLLYVAPEHLLTDPRKDFSQAGDVYSFAIVLFELLTRSEPYEAELETKNVTALLNDIKLGPTPIRPRCHSEEVNSDLLQLMNDCWNQVPEKRPSFHAIKKRLSDKFRSSSGKNILDMLLTRMEQYANNLEGLVEDRTQAFLDEKRKADELLFEILPRSVANNLKNGRAVDPEAYEEVTIYFSDIVGFTTISAGSSPFQVVDLLNDLYTCFDAIIDNFEVYKVETIGDAYMVVSGLPVRNGNNHVLQIARLSLSILKSVRSFRIRHMTTTPLRARIGLHTGPVCAGVVGRKMPRYCLFGDTVNTASRMESNGEAMKIHISETTQNLLAIMGTFMMEERGQIDVKGKGIMRTYWLNSEETTPLDEYMGSL